MAVQDRIAVFLAEFDLQVSEISRIYEILEKKAPLFEQRSAASEEVESAGYWMHNLYNAFEDLFKLVAAFWENDLAIQGDFHIHLLRRMLVRLEGVRPALVCEESYRCLNELRGFRHVFRHAYTYGLDAERISLLLRRALEKKAVLLGDIQAFRSAIAEML